MLPHNTKVATKKYTNFFTLLCTIGICNLFIWYLIKVITPKVKRETEQNKISCNLKRQINKHCIRFQLWAASYYKKNHKKDKHDSVPTKRAFIKKIEGTNKTRQAKQYEQIIRTGIT